MYGVYMYVDSMYLPDGPLIGNTIIVPLACACDSIHVYATLF